MVFVTNREWPIEVITLSSDHSRDSDDSDADLLYSTYHRPKLLTGIYPHLSKYLHWLYLLLRFTIIYIGISILSLITSPPEGVARYCFHPVCLSVCLSVCVCVCLCVCPANILVFYFSAIRRDIDLKFM